MARRSEFPVLKLVVIRPDDPNDGSTVPADR